jgi:hypothetical protein
VQSQAVAAFDFPSGDAKISEADINFI